MEVENKYASKYLNKEENNFNQEMKDEKFTKQF